MLIELTDNKHTAPIAWSSNRISRVVNDVMSAETLSMITALDTAFLLSTLVSELLYEGNSKLQIAAITDSESLYESAHSTKSCSNKRLRIDMSILREYIINDECSFTWVPSSDQLADIFTKEGVDDSNLLSHITQF